MMAPDKSAKLLMQPQRLHGSSRRWNQKQRGDRKGGNSRVEAERQGGGGGRVPGGKPRLESVSQLTGAAQRREEGGEEKEGGSMG